MKHLEPKQLPTAEPVKQTRNGSTLGWIATIAVFTLGVGAIGTWLLPVDRTDHVTQQERDRCQSEFAHSSPLSLPSIAAMQIDAALDDMKLPGPDREKLRALVMPNAALATQTAHQNTPISQSPPPQQAPLSISQPPVHLVSVTLWDTHSEDGDIVAVVSAGYRREIVLTHAPQTVSFPVDNAAAVQFVGVHDGGGGITLGIRGPQQEILMPIMSEGQTITVPVAR